jgi:hypothetical protein
VRRVAAYVAARRLSLVPVTTSLVGRADASLEVCHPAVSLRSLDATHLACVVRRSRKDFLLHRRLMSLQSPGRQGTNRAKRFGVSPTLRGSVRDWASDSSAA